MFEHLVLFCLRHLERKRKKFDLHFTNWFGALICIRMLFRLLSGGLPPGKAIITQSNDVMFCVKCLFGMEQMFALINQLQEFTSLFVRNKKVSIRAGKVSSEIFSEFERLFEQLDLVFCDVISFTIFCRALDKSESSMNYI